MAVGKVKEEADEETLAGQATSNIQHSTLDIQ